MTLIYDALLQKNPLSIARNRLLKRVAAPASEPLSLSETKLYLRIDSTAEDTLIGDLITAARMSAENWLRSSLLSQSWKLSFDDGIHYGTELPMGPVNSVSSVVIFNQDTTSQTVSSNAYWLNAAQNTLVTTIALTGFRIEITYNTGYADAASVPKPIKLGMLAHIAALYDRRGEGGEGALPEQVTGLYAPFREVAL